MSSLDHIHRWSNRLSTPKKKPHGTSPWSLSGSVRSGDHFFLGGAFFLSAGLASALSSLAGLSGVDFSCFTTASKSFWVFQP